ncbi:MAG: Trm112 family protein [Acidobacteria bacterium]|nr:Trm112 family protein [Acidobacteriota bacterium]
MPVNPRLLEILVCPLCKVKVSLTPNGEGLRCAKCRRIYAILNDIPNMLVEEARREEKKAP